MLPARLDFNPGTNCYETRQVVKEFLQAKFRLIGGKLTEMCVTAGVMPSGKIEEFSPLYLRRPLDFLAPIRSQAGRRRFDPGRPLH